MDGAPGEEGAWPDAEGPELHGALCAPRGHARDIRKEHSTDDRAQGLGTPQDA